MTVTHIFFPFIVVGCVRVLYRLYRKAVSQDRVGPLPRRPCAAAIILNKKTIQIPESFFLKLFPNNAKFMNTIVQYCILIYQ